MSCQTSKVESKRNKAYRQVSFFVDVFCFVKI